MAAQTETIEPGRAVIEAAAAWHVQLADEGCDEEDRGAFAAWIAADPTHGLAFERMAAIAGQASRQTAVERHALEAVLSRKPRAASLAVLVVLGALVTLGPWGAEAPSLRAELADRQTRIGEQRQLATKAGDRMVIDTDSALDIDDDRSLRLWRGGVMAQVAKGRAQPFVVRTPQGTARALGTRYSVRVEGDATIVSVLESRVEACARRGNARCLTLGPGQSAQLDARGAIRLGDIDVAREGAWSRGMLVADDRPLAAVLDELNRYRQTPIGYAADDIAGLHVSGTFPLGDTDRALASLSAALPIRVERSGSAATVTRR